MANLNKVSIPTALPAKSHLDLTCDHVTTMNFGEMQPVHYRHPIKGEHLDLSGIGTIRPMPLAAPTFGRMRCNINHFFVPWRIVFPQYESFYNDTIAVNASNASLIEDAPSIPNSALAQPFIETEVGALSPRFSTRITNYSSGDPFDICDGTNYFRLTTEGKYFYKILCGLGYAVNFDLKDSTPLSALPLLALCKIYIDYYANQSYLDSADVIAVKKWLAYNDPVTPLVLDGTDVGIICNLIKKVCYSQDYFVGSWDNPFAPNPNQFSAISFNDIKSGSTSNSVNSIVLDTSTTNGYPGGLPYMKQTSASSTNIGSQYLHDALKVITDYSRRHALAGATNLNRTLAQYGFGVEALKIDRALLLDSNSLDINTNAVFSTANTATAGELSTLGDYAGAGRGDGKSSFNYKVDEMGIQISLASIIPSGGYVQGMDENNMHVKRFQFYTPELDGLGVQVLRRREVYVSNDGNFGRAQADPSGELLYDKAFSFTGRYGEYKRPRSWLSGDFRVPTRFVGADAWNLFRLFSDATFNDSADNLVHSLNFTRYIDNDTYRRIFTNVTTDNDPFYAEFHWAVGSYAPCHGLFEGYEMETEGNKTVSLESNGSVVN